MKLYRFLYGDTYDAKNSSHLWNFMKICYAEVDPDTRHHFRHLTNESNERHDRYFPHIVGIEYHPYINDMGEKRFRIFFLLDDATARMMWRMECGAWAEIPQDIETDICSYTVS